MATHSSILAWKIPWTEELCTWDRKRHTQFRNNNILTRILLFNNEIDWFVDHKKY